MKTEHIFYCIFGLFLFAACSGGEDYERQLERFEEMNRTDVPLCVDSVQPLVRHYDHWWHSRNHRMRAYYMLGCAYRDQGEAPAAIHYYHIATEKADTIHADSATYATLFRIYGQMALIYEQQNMPKEEIETLNKLSKYASLAHDTLTSIMGEERKVVVYSQMDDTANVLRLTENVSQQYLKLGFAQKAARTFPTAIYVCLINKDYARARQYMDFFEKESGLFDEAGNIESGREQYYYSKGLYFMSQGEIDSAEICYRKLIPCGYLYEAYKGLLSVYESRNINDSIAKYIELTEQALEQWMANQQGTAIIQSSAMYKYERNQNLAEKKAREVSWLVQALITFLLIATLIAIYARYRNEKRKRKIGELEQRYDKAYTELLCAEETIMALEREKATNDNRIAAYVTKADQLREEVVYYQKALSKIDRGRKDVNLVETKIVNRFRYSLTHISEQDKVQDSHWQELKETVESLYPSFYQVLNERQELQENEYRVCLLVKAGFEPFDIDILMDKKHTYASNTRKRLHKKVFGIEGSGAEFDQKIRNI